MPRSVVDRLPINHVLIADDERDTARMLDVLVRLGNPAVTTAVAHDGHAAVAFALAQRPDAVILDLEMPGLDGAAVAAAIRAAFPQDPPMLIALSGNVERIAEERRGLLFDRALAKPLEVRRLVEILFRPATADQPGP